MKTLTEKIEDILRPAIDVRAPYARQMVEALAKLVRAEALAIISQDALRVMETMEKEKLP
jgi:hypothetical protein